MQVKDLRTQGTYKKISELNIGDFFLLGRHPEVHVLIDDFPYIIFNVEEGYPETVNEDTRVLPVDIEINIIG